LKNVANPRTSSIPLESEVTLVITNKGEDIAKDIAGLTSIIEYDLQPQPIQRIYDTYYDTHQGFLRRRKIGLRIRRIHGLPLVTIKSNPQSLDGKGVQRIEFEAPWSQESLAMIQRTLRHRQSKGQPHYSRHSPSGTLASMGLGVVQERMTRRLVRDIFRHDRPYGTPVAELDIDSVTYLGDPEIRIFEVEIEAKVRGSVKRIQEIAEVIQSNYSGLLREWPHGKLATGMAIRRLLKSRILQNYLDHGQLKSEAFPVIENSIVSPGRSRI
jgi:CYTH domain